MPTLVEFFVALEDPVQYKGLEGYAYWLGYGPVPKVPGWYMLDREKREFVKVYQKEWYELPPSQRVYIGTQNGTMAISGHNGDWKRGLDVGPADASNSVDFRVAYVHEKRAMPEANAQLRVQSAISPLKTQQRQEKPSAQLIRI